MKFNVVVFILSVLMSVNLAHVHVHADAAVRNPSQPLYGGSAMVAKKSKVTKVNGHILSLIIIGFGKKIATINDKEYQEGDVFGAYEVKKINSDHIVLEMSGKKKVLQLYAVNKTGFSIK